MKDITRIIHGEHPSYKDREESSFQNYAIKLLEEEFFEDYFQNAYWEKSFSSQKCLEMVEEQATTDCISLYGNFDYDTFFYNAYQATEKGLS